MIATYSDYIDKYISDTGGMHIPGEHHFVAIYLVPKLSSYLGVPDFVNPDGMKGIPGDIVYYGRDSTTKPWPMRLGIEVKIGSLKFSRTEYNDWMTEGARNRKRPHLFIGIARQGMLIGDWDTFASRFKSVAYPGNTAPELLDVKSNAERYTLTRELIKVVRDTENVLPKDSKPLPENLHWFPYAKAKDEAMQQEVECDTLLKQLCTNIVTEQKVESA